MQLLARFCNTRFGYLWRTEYEAARAALVLQVVQGLTLSPTEPLARLTEGRALLEAIGLNLQLVQRVGVAPTEP